MDITHDRAREVASRLIAGSFRRDGERLDDDKRPRFSIPTRIDHDDDTVIVAYIDQQRANNTHRPERFFPADAVTEENTGIGGYWSPAAAMIHSEHIAAARATLKGETP